MRRRSIRAYSAVAAVALVVAALMTPTLAKDPVFAPFEANNARKPIHMWDFETKSGSNYADLIGSNHMSPLNTVVPSGLACPSGGCVEVQTCSSHLKSINDFEASVGGDNTRSQAIWVYLYRFNGDGDSHAGIFGWGSSNNAGGDCTCSSFSTLGEERAREMRTKVWYHIALTHSSVTHKTKLYVNGQYSAEFSTTLNTRGAMRKFTVGSDTWWRATAHPACHAAFDEARVYDVELTADEIRQLYQVPRDLSQGVSDGGHYMPFEQESAAKMPYHYWTFDNDNKVEGGVCATGGFCHGDLVHDQHMVRYHQDGHSQYNGDCIHGECAQIDSCSSHFRSVNWFDNTRMEGSTPKSLSLWANVWSASGDGDHLLPLFSMGSSNWGNGDCDCSTFSSCYRGNGGGVGFIGCNCDVFPSILQPANSWFHTAIVYGGPGTGVLVYLNGRKVAELPGKTVNVRGALRPLLFGSDSWWRTNHHQACRMRIDEAKLYDYALTQDEIMQLYNPPQLSISEDDLKKKLMPFELANTAKRPFHLWDMETMVHDWRCVYTKGCYADLMRQNHLLRVNYPSATAYGGHDCPVGGCAEISSCSSWFRSLETVDTRFFGTGRRSISLWYSAAGYQGDGDSVVPLFSMGSSNAGRGDCTCSAWGATYHAGGVGFVGCSCDGWPAKANPVNTWQHVAITYAGSGGKQRIYLDGDLVGEYPLNINTRGITMEVLLGVDSWWHTTEHKSCRVRLDEVRLYDYELSADEVAELHDPPRSAPTAPLNVAAEADSGAARVFWDLPGDEGGGKGVTEYEVTVDPDPASGAKTRSVTAPTRELLFTGLTNGVEYTFTVKATNAQGQGPASDPSPGTTPEDGYGSHPVDGGGWEKFWWFKAGSIVDKSVESDVLGHAYGHCRRTDPYCFQRLPAGLVERDTELLAVDSNDNIYKWSFLPWLNTAHAAWRAFADGTEQAWPFHHKDTWNPTVLKGAGFSTAQDSFQYRMSNGFKSLALDDDNCDCHTTLSLGHAMCGSGWSTSYGVDGEIGVDLLDDARCHFNSRPSKDKGLTLYFRYKRAQWFTAIKTRVDDDTMAYDSAHWAEGVPFCENCDDTKNALFDAYRSKKVRKVRISMNSRQYTWELQPADYGKFTLKDMLASSGRLFRPPTGGGWKGTTRDAFAVGQNGHEHYYCWEYGINYNHHGGCTGKARIGVVLSQEHPCGHPGTSEGIGLKEDCQGDAMNSGRLQWSSETNFFHKATLEVYAEGEECPAGQYRSEGISGECLKCPEGTYRSTDGGVGLGSCTPCPAGRFGSSTGVTTDTCSGECQEGHYCPAGSTSGTQHKCPEGTYGATKALVDSGCTGPCPAGYFCEEATVDGTASPCQVGYWGGEGMSVSTCAGSCEPGHFCDAGSSSSTQTVCGAGFYCPFQTTERKTIPAGFYGIGGDTDETRSSILPCDRGHYCAGGELTPCPAGRYNPDTEKGLPTDCIQCAAGFFCPPGSTTSTQAPCLNGTETTAAVYCPPGTDKVLFVEADHYTIPENNPDNQRTGQLPCPDGHRCQDGIKYKLIDWSAGADCADDGAAGYQVNEDAVAGSVVATFLAEANYPGAIPVAYSILQQNVPAECAEKTPFSLDAAGNLAVGEGVAIDFETCGSFEVKVRAASGTATVDCDVSVVTADMNEAPVLEDSYARSVQEGRKPGDTVSGAIVATDADVGQELAYSIVPGVGDAPDGFFRIGACSGILSVAKAGLDHEVKGSYTLRVKVEDNGLPSPLSDEADVVVTVENINEAPVFTTRTPLLQVPENSGDGTAVGFVTATDNDASDTLTYTLTKNFDGVFAIDAATGELSVMISDGAQPLNYEVKNLYSIEVTVKDNAVPPLSDVLATEVRVLNGNDAPELKDATLSVAENSAIGTLVGAPVHASDEDQGTTILYEIASGNAGGTFAISQTGQISVAKASALNYEAQDQYQLGIRVTDDGLNGSGSGTRTHVATVTIDVTNVNERPVITGASLSVDENSAVNTEVPPAIAASDPDNANDPSLQKLTYTMTLGDESKFAVDPLTGMVKVVGDLDFETMSSATLGVDVEDSQMGVYGPLSASGTPDLAGGMYTDVASGESADAYAYKAFKVKLGSTVYEGQSINLFMSATSVTGVSAGTGGTQDLMARKFQLVSTDTTAKRESNDNDGWVQMRRLVVFEDGSYTLGFTAAIDTGEDWWSWRIIDEAGGSVVSSGTYASDLAGDAFPSVHEFRAFEVALGSVSKDTVLLLQFRSSDVSGVNRGDDDGQLLYAMRVSVTSSAASAESSVRETNEGYSPVTTLRVPESGKYEARFEAKIASGNDVFKWKLWRGAIVHVTINDVNEPPVLIGGQHTKVLENATIGDWAAENGLFCEDPDTGSTTFTYAIETNAFFTSPAGSTLPYFAIDADTGRLKVAGHAGVPDTYPKFDYETQTSLVVSVTCSDSDGATSAPETVVVNVMNLNEPPAIEDQTRSVAEHLAAGNRAGDPLVATDPDTGDAAITKFRLVAGTEAPATCSGLFAVAADGTVTMAAEAPAFGHADCTMTVEAYEDRVGGLSDSATLTIEIADTNRPPILNDAAVSVPEDTASGTVLITMVATDEDTNPPPGTAAQILTYRIASLLRLYDGDYIPETSTAYFTVEAATGKVSLNGGLANGALNFERTTSFKLEVLVEDDGPGRLTDSGVLTVTVTDVNEAPRINVPPMSIAENSADGAEVAMVTASDVDAGDTLTFTMAPDQTQHAGMTLAQLPFSIDPSSGLVTVSGSVNYEALAAYHIAFTVTDADGLSDSLTNVITVTNRNEPATTSDVAATVPENSAVPFTVATVPVNDPDTTGSTIGFAIVDGNAQGKFEIDGGTGVIRLLNPLDYEYARQHVLTVQVNDVATDASFEATSTVTVTVSDVADTTVEGFMGAGGAIEDHLSIPTAGSQLVKIRGSGLGPTGARRAAGETATVTATYGPAGQDAKYSAMDCKVAANGNNEITCLAAPGLGTFMTWTVTLVDDGTTHRLTVPGVSSYEAPTISSVETAAASPTAGGAVVVIRGANFGPSTVDNVLVVRYGSGTQVYTPATCTVADHNKITCETVAGVGTGHVWQVRVGGQTSANSVDTTDYAAPTISSVTAAGPLATVGGESVTIVGTNLGPGTSGSGTDSGGGATPIGSVPAFAVSGAYGAADWAWYQASCTVTVAHTVVVCTSAPGTGTGHAWKLTVGGQTSALSTDTTSYAAPTIVAISGSGAIDGTTEGGSRIIIEGTNFGPTTPTAGLQLAGFGAIYGHLSDEAGVRYTAADCSVMSAHTKMTCVTAPGVGYGFAWAVTVGGQESAAHLELFAGHETDPRMRGTSYAAPIISFFQSAAGGDVNAFSTEGNEYVLIHGLNMGNDANAIESVQYQMPGTEAPFEVQPIRCSIETPHKLLKCPTVSGAGHNLEWRVVIARQVSRNPVTGYGRPTVTAITGATVASLSTDGGEWVTVTGTNFGPIEGAQVGAPFVERVRYGRTGTEYEAEEVRVLGHDTLAVKTMPGVGQGLVMVVTVATQDSPVSTATLSYALPTITAVTPQTAPTFSSLVTPTKVTVTGRNFGLLDSLATVRLVFGNEADGTRVPGYVTPTSKTPNWEDDASVAAHTAGGDHVLTFDLPSGIARHRGVRVVVTPRGMPTEAVTSAAALFHYQEPKLDFVEVSSTSSGGIVTDGDATAEEDTAAAVLGVTVKELRRLTIYGDDLGAPASVGGADSVKREVLVEATDKDGVVQAPYTTSVVHVAQWDHHQVVLYTAVPYGNIKLRISSSNYTGLGGDHAAFTPFQVAATTQVQESNVREYADFSPAISNLAGASSPLGFATAGGELLELTLQHLSSTNRLEVRVNNVTCQLVWLNPATGLHEDVADADIRTKLIEAPGPGAESWDIKCRMPAGEGANQRVVVYRDGQRSGGGISCDSSTCINYARPNVETVVVTTAGGAETIKDATDAAVFFAPTHGAVMELRGSNFGLCPVIKMHDIAFPLGQVTFCGPEATAGATRTHSVLRFPVPEGEGTGLSVHATGWTIGLQVAGQVPIVPATMATQVLPFRYFAPAVATIDAVAGKVPTRGGVTMRVTGRNFGVFSAGDPGTLPGVWLGDPTVGPDSLGLKACANVVQVSHTELTCELPEGTGRGLTARVKVSDQTSPFNATALFSYDAPRLGVISTASGRRLAGAGAVRPATQGGLQVTVTGTNLGTRNATHCVFVTWKYALGTPVCGGVPFTGEGELADSDIVSHDHEKIVFTLPPGIGTYYIGLGIRGQLSDTLEIQYGDPKLHAVQPIFPNHGPTEGGTSLLITGENFGEPSLATFGAMQVQFFRDLCSAVRMQQCEATGAKCPCSITAHSHTAIEITTPPGIGVEREVKVSITAAPGEPDADTRVAETAPALFSYDPPVVELVIPNRANAMGEPVVQIRGRNFGSPGAEKDWTPEEQTVAIDVHGVTCDDGDRVVRAGTVVLECRLREDVVGLKNVTITVAGQTGSLPYWTETFFTRCPKDTYGQTGEWCLDCPQGADCAGGLAEPLSQPGWFILNDTAKEFCHEKRQHRDYCNHVVPCEPKDACTGSNTCAVGYKSVAPVHRCADCDDCYQETPGAECKRFYRRAGECVECPDNPWVLVAAFLAMAIFLCVSGYILNRKAVNLAFLTIGMDYFQILALFARSRVKWPAMIKEIFHLMSVFNLNIEITAPECSIPDLGYKAKWFGIEALPLAAAGLFLICHVAIVFKKRCIMGRKKKLNTHASALVAMLLVMMYVMYLFITRTILDVFNCAPTDPPDGHEYLEVVFEPCWEAGSIQVTLLPFGIMALLVYTLGYPATVFFCLWKNKMLVMEDQLLRAKGMGDVRLENPNAYDVRKRYHKMYYHFKPDRWYWIMAILARKFFIAFTALMFNRNPGFQLSVALLVMFMSYALQVKHNPYMSMSERADVLRDHYQQAMIGGVHATLAARIERVVAKGKRATKAALSMEGARDRAVNRQAALNFFFNYNTVESVLLACAVLVNLAGVMFESNRFQASDYYDTQRDIITVVVLLIIFCSIVYFSVVFFSEVYVTFCGEKAARKAAKKGRGKGKAGAKGGHSRDRRVLGSTSNLHKTSMPGEDEDMSASVNPMFMQMQAQAAEAALASSDLPSREKWEQLRETLANMKKELLHLTDENRELKAELGKEIAAETESTMARREQNKNEFRPRRAVGRAGGRSAGRRGPRKGRRPRRREREPAKSYVSVEMTATAPPPPPSGAGAGAPPPPGPPPM